MSERRDRYFRTLGLPDRSGELAKAALARAYKLRDFEIEHYWKRATYFWAFQVAIFAAFGLLWKETGTKPDPVTLAWSPITVALAGLGILTAVANALSARGSRFWQNNWEKHIDMLEDGIEGRLYKTVWLSEGKVSFSVSRVNQYLSDSFVVFWALIAFYVACSFVGSWRPDKDFFHSHLLRLIYVIIIGMIGLGGVVLLSGQTTHLDGTLPNSQGEHNRPLIKRRPRWRPRRWLHRLRRWWRKLGWSKHILGGGSQTFIRRRAPDE